VAILPPQSLKLAALLFDWSSVDLNARHYPVETKVYRSPVNLVKFRHFPRISPAEVK